MNVVVIVDIAIFIQTANRSVEMGDFAFRFRMQPNRVFAISQIGLARTDFSVLADNHLFVELLSKVVPELLPVLYVIELGMFGRRTQLDSDNGVLYRSMLG